NNVFKKYDPTNDFGDMKYKNKSGKMVTYKKGNKKIYNLISAIVHKMQILFDESKEKKNKIENDIHQSKNLSNDEIQKLEKDTKDLENSLTESIQKSPFAVLKNNDFKEDIKTIYPEAQLE
ncbi:MAG: hypothetical protein KDH96_12770, partial [Candidatus Riesia sp.]|nr:hypothetical protein [Candidatus Riesia sp.]